MDEGCSDAVKEVFVRLYDKGLIYRGNRMVNWCPHCLSLIHISLYHRWRYIDCVKLLFGPRYCGRSNVRAGNVPCHAGAHDW